MQARMVKNLNLFIRGPLMGNKRADRMIVITPMLKPADRKNVRKPSLRKCLLVRIRHIAAVAGAECYGKACCAIANAGKSDEMYYFLLCAVGPCA